MPDASKGAGVGAADDHIMLMADASKGAGVGSADDGVKGKGDDSTIDTKSGRGDYTGDDVGDVSAVAGGAGHESTAALGTLGVIDQIWKSRRQAPDGELSGWAKLPRQHGSTVNASVSEAEWPVGTSAGEGQGGKLSWEYDISTCANGDEQDDAWKPDVAKPVPVAGDGPTVAPRNHSPKDSQKEKNSNLGKNTQKQILVLRAFKGPRGPARMRKPLEMYTALRMQNMV